MHFTHRIFLFYFLPAALILHRLALSRSPKGTYGNWPRLTIFALTLVFYGWENPWWLIPFLAAVFCDFLWARLISEASTEGRRKFWLWVSVFQNLALLAVFKYWNLIIDGVATVKPAWAAFLPRNTHSLPAGISFYTFESMSFVIDVYRRVITPPKSRLEFLAFIGMFPRFIAGPIVRYRDLRTQFENYEGMQVGEGMRTFILGLFRKACLADSFALLANYAFGGAPELDFVSAWVGVFAYTMQIYFDFSGYSLMAIGLGKCLGFSFAANFDRPYLATSFKDFWRRWHISLSTWLRDYLYISLGGGKKGNFRTYVNLFLTMVLGGLWHGASLTFLAWGAWHGTLLALERYTGFSEKLPQWAGRAVTFLGVMIGWVFFRAETFAEAGRVLTAMASPFNHGLSFNPTGAAISPLAMIFCLAGVVFCFSGETAIETTEGFFRSQRVRDAIPLAVAAIALIVLLSNQVVPFLYFQF